MITVEKDHSIKLAHDSSVLNKAIHKNKYPMPTIEMLIDAISEYYRKKNETANLQAIQL